MLAASLRASIEATIPLHILSAWQPNLHTASMLLSAIMVFGVMEALTHNAHSAGTFGWL